MKKRAKKFLVFGAGGIIVSFLGFFTLPVLARMGLDLGSDQQFILPTRLISFDHQFNIGMGLMVATLLIGILGVIALIIGTVLYTLSLRQKKPSPTAAPLHPTPTPSERITVRKPAITLPPKPTFKRNPVKDTLYGDVHLNQWPPPGVSTTESPWADFAAARHHLEAGRKGLAITHWQAVLATPALESLHYMQAWFFLRQNDVRPEPEEAYKVFGVVAENGPSGVLIAAFEDGQARLYSDQGQGIVWGRPDTSLDPLIVSVLIAACPLVDAGKPWKTAHISLPKSNINSISVLTPSGLFIKTGIPPTFESDPLVKPVIEQLGLLMRTLMEKSGEAA